MRAAAICDVPFAIPCSARLTSFAMVALSIAACGGATLNDGTNDGQAGSDGGTGDGGCALNQQRPLDCPGACGSSFTDPVCVDGVWECPAPPSYPCVIEDGGGFDAGRGDAGTLTCGKEICNASTEYCDIRGGGPPLLDGGSSPVVSTCMPLPAMPCEPGTGCECIPDRCSCNDKDGAITNECLFP